jgi:aryl-alcohol dehydrogenase-like predicted oxidoreductase
VDNQGAPHEVKDHSCAHLLSQTTETAALLGDHLALYQIHSATLESGVLDDEAVLGALRALKAERGWRIGLSVSGPQQAAVIRKAFALHPPLFDSVQATFNLLEQSAGAALSEAKAAGASVIVKEAMANGRLLAAGNPAADAVRATADRLGVPADALCLAAVMRQPFAPMVLSGAATVEQLRSNTCALEIVERGLLDDSTLAELMAACRAEPVDYWQERGALQWN